MKFFYKGIDQQSREVSGEIEATNKLEAIEIIFNEKGIKITTIQDENENQVEKKTKKAVLDFDENFTKIHIGRSEKQKDTAGEKDERNITDRINDWLIDHSGVPLKEKVIFFRLLSVMINAGLPIVKSLKILNTQTKNEKLKRILIDVAKKVEGGESFSSALKKYDNVFTDSEVGIIASGEASGQMNKVLNDLAEEAEKSNSLKSKIKSAMIYPVVVLAILVGVTVVVMTLVVPKLSEMFLGAGVNLPTSTKALINTSAWFTSETFGMPNWLNFLLGIFGATSAVKAWKNTKSGKFYWDKLMLNVPVFGTLNKKVALAAFTRQLATLSSSGISIIRALDIIADALDNAVYGRAIRKTKNRVEKGVSISETITGNKLFPELVTSMLSVGEQTAQMGSVAKKISEFYDEEVDTFVKNLSTAMEPLIIVIVGTLVGGLVAAIMQPIMQIADVASQAG